jgi:hypothetical protein
MKLLTIIFSLIMSFQTFAAPTTSETDDITMEEIQAELMNEIDTMVVDEDDVAFLDEEIEKKTELTVQNKKSEPAVKKSAQAPAATATKK